MKTSRTFLAAAGAIVLLAAPALAEDLLDSPLDQAAAARPGRQHGRHAGRAPGLQLGSGLQLSGPLNGSGPGAFAVRLSAEEWRAVFPRKEAQR